MPQNLNRGVILPSGTKGGHVHNIAEIAAVVITNPRAGDVLRFDGAVWRNASLPKCAHPDCDEHHT